MLGPPPHPGPRGRGSWGVGNNPPQPGRSHRRNESRRPEPLRGGASKHRNLTFLRRAADSRDIRGDSRNLASMPGCGSSAVARSPGRDGRGRTGAEDMRLVAHGLTAVGAPSVGPGVTLASAGPSVARTQAAALGGSKCKAEDAATRSVSAAARGARGLADGAQAHNRPRSVGKGAALPSDLPALFAVSPSSLTTPPGTATSASSFALPNLPVIAPPVAASPRAGLTQQSKAKRPAGSPPATTQGVI